MVSGQTLKFPVLDLKRSNPPKLTDVMRDQGEPARDRLASDQHIGRPDGSAGPGQSGAQFASMTRVFAIEIQHLELQSLNTSVIFRDPSSLVCAIKQLVRDNGGNGEVLGAVLADPCQEASMTFQNGQLQNCDPAGISLEIVQSRAVLFRGLLGGGLLKVIVEGADDLVQPLPIAGVGFKNDGFAMAPDGDLTRVEAGTLWAGGRPAI